MGYQAFFRLHEIVLPIAKSQTDCKPSHSTWGSAKERPRFLLSTCDKERNAMIHISEHPKVSSCVQIKMIYNICKLFFKPLILPLVSKSQAEGTMLMIEPTACKAPMINTFVLFQPNTSWHVSWIGGHVFHKIFPVVFRSVKINKIYHLRL